MFDTQFMHLVLRLLLTAFLGGIIGLERSAGDRPAGLCRRLRGAGGGAALSGQVLYPGLSDPGVRPGGPAVLPGLPGQGV